MAAPAVGSIGTVLGGSSSTTADVPLPSGNALDNIIVTGFYLESGTATMASVPTGFAEAAASPTATSGSNTSRIYWKRQTSATGAGETTGTYPFVLTAGLAFRDAHAIRFTGCSTSVSPFDTGAGAPTSAIKTTTTDGTTPAVSLTTQGPDRLLVWVATAFNGGNIATPPTGFTEQFDDGGMVLATKVQAIAGPTGSVTATFGATGITQAWLCALVPIEDVPRPPPRIPNRYVGPMALRNKFRRATAWTPDVSVVSLTATADTAVTVGLTADGVVGVVGGAATAVTVGLTAAGVVGAVGQASTAVTVGLTADGVVGIVGATTDTAVTVGLTADGALTAVDTGQPPSPLRIPNRNVGPMALRAAFRQTVFRAPDVIPLAADSTTTAVTVGLTTDGAVGTVGAATTAITVGLSAASLVGTVGAATTAITVGLTAAGVVGVTGDATTAITVGLTADGAVPGVDTGLPATPLRIPNRNVGPQALRYRFHRPTVQASAGVDVTGAATATAVTVGLTADGFVGVSDSTTTAVTVGLTAAGVVGAVEQTTTTAVTVGLTADGKVGITAQTTTTAVTVGLTASGVAGAVGQTTTAVTIGLTAAGTATAAGTVGTTPLAITVGLTAAGVVEIIVPANRTCAVKVESRTAAVRVESRVAAVKPESRVAAVKPESRTALVKPESRTVLGV